MANDIVAGGSSATNQNDKRAPMASAPMLYNADNTVAWDQMWDTFCVLASEGGPPHRGALLRAQVNANPQSVEYQWAAQEIIRGIALVSGLQARMVHTGWIAVECGQAGKARWLSEQIVLENVESYYEGAQLYVPVSADFTLKGEIKNVITVVAKATHYWAEHLAAEVKTSLAWEERIKAVSKQLRHWFRRR